jgi:NAD(P)-dependent dehydrogenase (short-subunit alcohol dehydrogenase family)
MRRNARRTRLLACAKLCGQKLGARAASRAPTDTPPDSVLVRKKQPFKDREDVCQTKKPQSSREQQGVIGVGLIEGFREEGYGVVATSLHASQSLTASPSLVLVDGDIGKQETAGKVVETAIQHFGAVDVLVNNAGIFLTKPFTDFTTEDFDALVSTNLRGFLYTTQLVVKQMLKQKSGNVVSITAALADQPIAGVNASVSMITKGGLNTVTRSLAIEYANEGIRFNAVAPGTVETPLRQGCTQGIASDKAAHEDDYESKRHSRRGSLSSPRGASNRRDNPRRRWLSRWPLVAAKHEIHPEPRCRHLL